MKNRRGRRRGPHGRRPHGPPHGRHHYEFWQGAPPGAGPHAWREQFEQFFGKPLEQHWMFGGRRFRPWQSGEAEFNPFVAMALSKGGGLLPLYVLHLLDEEPRYGNEIMGLIAERTEGGWTTNPGAIYPLLTELEEQGFIAGDWEDEDRRTTRSYEITDAGREELARLKAVMRPKLAEALAVLQDMLDDLDDMDAFENAPDEPNNEDMTDGEFN